MVFGFLVHIPVFGSGVGQVVLLEEECVHWFLFVAFFYAPHGVTNAFVQAVNILAVYSWARVRFYTFLVYISDPTANTGYSRGLAVRVWRGALFGMGLVEWGVMVCLSRGCAG